MIQEQLSRPDERRCPIAKASNEVVELLSEHWAIFAPGCKFTVQTLNRDERFYFADSTSTTFQPFFLDLQRVHSLATQFFIRMWADSGAARGDYSRVVALVRSQYVFLFHFLYPGQLILSCQD
jgi:engulfment/cell motility protein 1